MGAPYMHRTAWKSTPQTKPEPYVAAFGIGFWIGLAGSTAPLWALWLMEWLR